MVTPKHPLHSNPLQNLRSNLCPRMSDEAPRKRGEGEPAPKKLTGLQMPLDVSPALAAIIGTKKGEQVNRAQVMKKLWAYLKEKNLQVRNRLVLT